MEALKENNIKKENILKERLKNIGPGALIAAGFIGPGTITTYLKSITYNVMRRNTSEHSLIIT